MENVLEEDTRARTEKLCSCWKYKWVLPIGKAANPCPQTWIAEKTFTKYFCIFNKQSFSVLGKKVATQQAHQSGLEK